MAGKDLKKIPLHKGHRQRLQQRFVESGLDNFTDIQVLEILLFNVIPRADTNPIAHKLLNSFGSLAQTLDAPLSELIKIDGIGDKAAIFIKTLAPLSRRYMHDKINKKHIILNEIDKVIEYIQPLIATKTDEVFYIISLDSKCGVIAKTKLSEGVVNETSVYPRQVVSIALKHNASSIILAHNHPSGDPTPSVKDNNITQRLYGLMLNMNIPILDHVIIAGANYYSYARSSNFLT